MRQNTCLRCGHTWWPRGNWRTRNFTAKRCASCRSPYWNKPYVRFVCDSRLNPHSSFDAKTLPAHKPRAKRFEAEQYPLPFVPAHDAGAVSIKTLSKPVKLRRGSGAVKQAQKTKGKQNAKDANKRR